MLQVKPKEQIKERILETIRGIFPNTTVMFVYYCGSFAYGLNDENSDEDITVVLDGFKGNVHLCLGELDIFAYDRDVFRKKQNLDPSVPLYNRASIDDILSEKDSLIYLDENYREEYEAYKKVDFTKTLGLFLESFVELNNMRMEYPTPQKAHYHIFRVRGILDHVDQTGKYRHQVHEPWKTHMIEYKKKWNTSTGRDYMPLLREALAYIEKYKNRVISHELGEHPQSIQNGKPGVLDCDDGCCDYDNH